MQIFTRSGAASRQPSKAPVQVGALVSNTVLAARLVEDGETGGFRQPHCVPTRQSLQLQWPLFRINKPGTCGHRVETLDRAAGGG